jgi:16S rRNA G1207 methylase RsmC
LKGFASEPIDGTGNDLLLDVLSELIVELKALLDVGCGFGFLCRGLGWLEEVEE